MSQPLTALATGQVQSNPEFFGTVEYRKDGLIFAITSHRKNNSTESHIHIHQEAQCKMHWPQNTFAVSLKLMLKSVAHCANCTWSHLLNTLYVMGKLWFKCKKRGGSVQPQSCQES